MSPPKRGRPGVNAELEAARRHPITMVEVRELVDSMLRHAFQEHSRALETHLNDIHTRISRLESGR